MASSSSTCSPAVADRPGYPAIHAPGLGAASCQAASGYPGPWPPGWGPESTAQLPGDVSPEKLIPRRREGGAPALSPERELGNKSVLSASASTSAPALLGPRSYSSARTTSFESFDPEGYPDKQTIAWSPSPKAASSAASMPKTTATSPAASSDQPAASSVASSPQVETPPDRSKSASPFEDVSMFHGGYSEKDIVQAASPLDRASSGLTERSFHPPGFLSSCASSSVEGCGFQLDHSPAARSNKAPSDPPSASELDSWRDDASSSLAPSGTAHGMSITVNTQRTRMGEHLKDKFQGMIRQRFENYLHIIQTLQNNIGKMEALTCELRIPSRPAAAGTSNSGYCTDGGVRANISCHEDGTFLVYAMLSGAHLYSHGSSLPSSSNSQAGSEVDPEEPTPDLGNPVSSKHCTDAAGPSGALADQCRDSSTGLLDVWVQQVNEFGMSGRCHSLTSLFHFGYTVWKQLWQDTQVNWGMEVVEDTSPCQTAENEEKDNSSKVPSRGEPPRQATTHAMPSHAEAEQTAGRGACASKPAEDGAPPVKSTGESVADIRSLPNILASAHDAEDNERFQQALELCAEGLALVRSQHKSPPAQRSRGALSTRSSSSSTNPASATVAVTWSDEDDSRLGARGSSGALWELLSLQASVHTKLALHPLTLEDAEELIALEPTCAEGYYWQSVAFHGMQHSQEAIEALMSALEFEPQNPLYTQMFTALFEEISSARVESVVGNPPTSSAPVTGEAILHPRGNVLAPGEAVLPRRSRGTGPRDALSTTTQASHLSSRSTTSTEVSPQTSRSSSCDSIDVASAALCDDA
eukprot:TRINITY_DN87376_c0_g1_i1.p1 TRINITY_DN87376_c0_g1~~TRINITY_DN87376_c0_g1_i1.p1  ORF type:complete len:812 (+),score=116.85 TRINITY_DN87376_c0_g1_i1:121-2556(+)